MLFCAKTTGGRITPELLSRSSDRVYNMTKTISMNSINKYVVTSALISVEQYFLAMTGLFQFRCERSE